MINTVVSTNSTLGYTLGTSDSLTVLATASIVNPAAAIEGVAAGLPSHTDQTVTIAGLVDIDHVSVGPTSLVTLASSATLISHGKFAIGIGDRGIGDLGTVGDCIVTTAGQIVAADTAIQAVGSGNLISNTGQIVAANTAIQTAVGGSNSVFNGGLVSSRVGFAVQMNGLLDSLENSGTLRGLTGGVRMAGLEQSLHNTGLIERTGGTDEGGHFAIEVLGALANIVNDGIITTAGQNFGIGNLYTPNLNSGGVWITNNGTIEAAVGISGYLPEAVIINNGSIIGASAGVSLSFQSSGGSFIQNHGVIMGVFALDLAAGTDTVRNTGTLMGDVRLGNGSDTFDTRGGTVVGIVSGGRGNDTFWMNDASVEVSEDTNFAIGGKDTINATVSYRLWDGVEVLNLIGANDIDGTGTTAADTITGNSGDNRLAGLDGADSLFGDAGDDVLAGNRLGDRLYGGDGNDRLLGGLGNDSLWGDDDDDVLIGGVGRDTMDGGSGEDRFVFGKAADTGATTATADIIAGFQLGQDIIDLSGIDAKSTNAAPNDTFIFIGTAAFSGVAGQLHVLQAGGNTFAEYDLNGDSVADGVIRLNGLYTLTAGDFVL